MMADYKMIEGMPGWMQKHNQFVSDQLIEISAWSNSGLTYLNGFSAPDATNAVRYRTIKIGGKIIAVNFAGKIAVPALKASQGVIEFCKVPSGLLPTGFSRASNTFTNLAVGQQAVLDYQLANNALTMSVYGLTKDVIAHGGIEISLGLDW